MQSPLRWDNSRCGTHRIAPVLLLGAALLPVAAPGDTRRAAASALGYVDTLPAETDADRTTRLRLVRARRLGPSIMVHRGAAAFAPENTLEAYAAAMDYGADGCEVDLRRTADGVLVLFHDDMLDRLTNGFGTVDRISYFELLSLRPQFQYGTARPETRPPTFAAVLSLARQRAMLLHLDVKERGLEPEIAAMLDAAGTWEHVVAVNGETAPALLRHPRFRPLSYKGPGLYTDRRDVDPGVVRAQLERPGQLLMVDDPRVAARELKRPPYAPVPLPSGLRRSWPSLAPATTGSELDPAGYLRSRAARTDARSVPALLELLAAAPTVERLEPDGAPEYRRQRTEGILDRAWAARRLGELGNRSPEVVAALERQLRERSLHPDWMYHGLDAAVATRALAELGATRSVPFLAEWFMRVDPQLRRVVNPAFGPNPLGWTDFRAKINILSALGQLRSPAARAFLLEYVALPAEKAREVAPPQFEEATRALLRQELTREQLEALVGSANPAVRGTAILECLDHPSRERTAALRAGAPWALDLPRAGER